LDSAKTGKQAGYFSLKNKKLNTIYSAESSKINTFAENIKNIVDERNK
jgi:hypothetical protein